MTGEHRIYIRATTEDNHNIVREVVYDFTLRRNITIIQGDSGAGKTTFIRFIDLVEHGSHAIREFHCDVPVMNVKAGANWKAYIQSLHDSILVFDENVKYTSSDDFADVVNSSSCYFIIIVRKPHSNLSYSYKEIYKMTLKEHSLDMSRVYNTIESVWSEYSTKKPNNITDIVTEDSDAGFTFFNSFGIHCTAAGTRNEVVNIAKTLSASPSLLVVCDGAAAGSIAKDLFELITEYKNVCILLPECIEWVIFASSIIDNNDINRCNKQTYDLITSRTGVTNSTNKSDILGHTADYVRSEHHCSWERFYHDLLVWVTTGTQKAYSKNCDMTYYLSDKHKRAILQVMGYEDILMPKDNVNASNAYTNGNLLFATVNKQEHCYSLSTDSEALGLSIKINNGESVSLPEPLY